MNAEEYRGQAIPWGYGKETEETDKNKMPCMIQLCSRIEFRGIDQIQVSETAGK